MVEYQLPKLATGVRFPSLAPFVLMLILIITVAGCATAPTPPPIETHIATKAGVIHHTVGRNESFIWPVRGYVLVPFGSKVNNVINKGIDIKAQEGSSVKAARSGKVVYCDSHLKGFGKTVIIDHGEGLQSVYSYNSDIMVSVGGRVAKSETIAKVGRTGRAKEPSLHFEIRKDGEPQNPLYYLPR